MNWVWKLILNFQKAKPDNTKTKNPGIRARVFLFRKTAASNSDVDNRLGQDRHCIRIQTGNIQAAITNHVDAVIDPKLFDQFRSRPKA